MGLLGRLIQWILSLLGVGRPKELSAGEKETIRGDTLRGTDDLTGQEHVHVFGSGAGARVVRSADGADLIQEGSQTQWVERLNLNVPPRAWTDDFGPLSGPASLDDFVFHELEFNRVRAGDPLEAEKKLLGHGYRSVGQFFRVRATMAKHHATHRGPTLRDAVFDSQAYSNSVMRAEQRRLKAEHQAAMSGNPGLLAPIEGVTLEQFAAIAARAAQSPPQDQFIALLAQHRLDLAAWNRVNAQWTDRMSKDTSGAIATAYGNAFLGGGQGQYGSAGQAAATAGWGGNGGAAGAEPIPFEKLCEIQGAMSAWGKTGQDVNANLKKHFNMVAADWSSASMWWLTHLMADLHQMEEYHARSAMYEQQYMGARRSADQDIQF